jgi:hypothetical protein
MVISGDLNLLYDDRILTEYREVLLRKKFGSAENDVDTLLEYIETEGLRITSTISNESLKKYLCFAKTHNPRTTVILNEKIKRLLYGNI